MTDNPLIPHIPQARPSLLDQFRALRSAQAAPRAVQLVVTPASGDGPPLPPLCASELTDPSALIGQYHERLSIALEDSEVTETEAHRIASEEIGASILVLAQRQNEYWHDRLRLLPRPANPRLVGLLPTALAFVESPECVQLAREGWTEAEIFGLDPQAGNPTLIDYLQNGLVPWLALNPRQGPWTILEITRNAVTVAGKAGHKLTQSRHGRFGPSIWSHPNFKPAPA